MSNRIIDWLLKTEVKEFISKNSHLSSAALMLKIPKNWDYKSWIVSQIESKTKAQKKLPTWFKHDEILWPLKLNIEQTSSETTAQYKAQLLKCSELLDGTGGFGVDVYYFSKTCTKTIHVEKNSELSDIAEYNFKILNKTNTTFINDTFENVLQTIHTVDIIYLDPARRIENEKVFMFKDCIPNVIELKEQLLKKANLICIKASPMIDLQKGIEELIGVKEIHVISVNNECKEVLFFIENKKNANEIPIHCINFQNYVQQSFEGSIENEKSIELNYYPESVKKYLYEPNASIMKAGFFKLITTTYNLEKLNNNTHLYTSNELISNFPGKVYEIEQCIPPKELKKYIPDLKMNFHLRNFPTKIDVLKKELKIKEGGIHDVFATSLYPNEKRLLVCKRIIFS
jgi:16S rRNA G966 N2-methylase RsmD